MPKAAKPVVYRHKSHLEWGLGVIVEESPAKLYVSFEDGKRRPFLNEARHRSQLVTAELSADATQEILAKIVKVTAKPAPPKAAGKKAKKAVKVPVDEEVLEGLAEDDDHEEADDE